MDARLCLQLCSRSPACSGGGGAAFTRATKGLKAQGIGGLIRTILPHYSTLLFLYCCFSILLMWERPPKVALLLSFVFRRSSAFRSACCQSQKLRRRPDCDFLLFPLFCFRQERVGISQMYLWEVLLLSLLLFFSTHI